MALEQKDIDRIADAMVVRIQKTHHDFWIDPQEHYDDHTDMKEVVKSWRTGKSIFTRIFVGLMVTGSVILALLNFGIRVKGG